MAVAELTQQQLKQLLQYNQETGAFTNAAGRQVGSPKGHRYVRIYLLGRMHYAHRLAWLYMTGAWPADGVDHRDGDGLNNRWINLREATQAQNLQNQRTSRGPTSRHLGVCWHKASGKWRATIVADGVRKHLGLFDDEDLAAQAYRAAKREMHEFAAA